jgi:predicted amidohydrolase
MRVAGVQFDIAWEKPTDNFRHVRSLVQQALDREARLVILPEMFATGFSMEAARMAEHAEATKEFISKTARDHDLWIMAGLVEAEAGGIFNVCSLAAPDGHESVRFRKIHPFTLAGEQEHYAAGDELVTADIEGLRVTPVICYDLRFPELFRAAAHQTDLFVVPANWPDRRSLAWRVLLQARAIDCQAWVFGINRIGQDANLVDHRGDTALIDPMGEVVSSLAWDEGVIVGDVDPKVVAEVRRKYPFLEDRRPDVYRSFEE